MVWKRHERGIAAVPVLIGVFVLVGEYQRVGLSAAGGVGASWSHSYANASALGRARSLAASHHQQQSHRALDYLRESYCSICASTSPLNIGWAVADLLFASAKRLPHYFVAVMFAQWIYAMAYIHACLMRFFARNSHLCITACTSTRKRVFCSLPSAAEGRLNGYFFPSRLRSSGDVRP